jgi:vitamin B12 transporter
MLDWRQALNLTSWNKLFFGAMYYHEEGVSSTFGTFNGNSGPPPVAFGPSTSGGLITDPAVYFQDQINIGERWFTTVGVRQDNYNLAGTATTYRLSSLYRLPGTETAIRGSVGTGFKAPSIFQLFDTFNGNPNLRPEESTGYDFGFDQPVLDGRVVLSATYFHNTYKNLINFAPALGPFGLYFNSTDAQTAGLEFSSLWRVNDRTTVTGTYTKLNSMQGFSPDNTNFTGGPDPLVSNQRLIRRPDDAASLGVNRRYLNNRANVNLSVIYVGQRDDIGFVTQGATTVRTRVSLDPYVVANLAASYDLTSRVQLFGRIDNLTDTHYEQIYGFSTVPFSGYAGMNVRW